MLLAIVLQAAAAQGGDDSFLQGLQALKKGLYAKAWELLRTHYRTDPAAAWADARMQESLCMCAVKMRKTTIAISACQNASELRSPTHSASLTLLMARGEARLLAAQPQLAWDEFRKAKEKAVSGEALKQEKEALEAMRRAEQALFVSFSRHRGSVVATPSQILSPTSVKGGTYASLPDALSACAALRECGALSTKLLGERPSRGERLSATLYNASTVKDDLYLKPTQRQVSYVRDTPTCKYAIHAGTLIAGLFSRTLPPEAASRVARDAAARPIGAMRAGLSVS